MLENAKRYREIALSLLSSDEYYRVLLTGKTPGTPGTAVNASSGKAFFSKPAADLANSSRPIT